jgi:lipoprotein-anchoring transpeptidase ErfK/SrfK
MARSACPSGFIALCLALIRRSRYHGNGRNQSKEQYAMSHLQRRGLPHAFSVFIKIGGAGALLLSLGACTELARFVSKPEAKPDETVVAEEVPATPTPEPNVEKPKPSKLYEWNGDGRTVSRIVIDTDQQRALFYSGDEEVGWSTVASGLPKHPTPTGEFAVMEKIENKRSNLYGKYVQGKKVVKASVKAGRDPVPPGATFEGAHMPFFMRLTYDGIGLHAGPIPRPGQPASHGCIRLPSTLAPVLFRHVSHGTPVTIVGSGPSYGDYVEKVRIAEAQRAAREAEQRRLAEQQAADAAASGLATASVGESPRPSHSPSHSPSQPRSTERPAAQPVNPVSGASSSAADSGARSTESNSESTAVEQAAASGPTSTQQSAGSIVRQVEGTPGTPTNTTLPPAPTTPRMSDAAPVVPDPVDPTEAVSPTVPQALPSTAPAAVEAPSVTAPALPSEPSPTPPAAVASPSVGESAASPMAEAPAEPVSSAPAPAPTATETQMEAEAPAASAPTQPSEVKQSAAAVPAGSEG